MSTSLQSGALTVSVIVIGAATLFYAAEVAYDGADQTAPVIDNLHPIADLLLWIVPFAVLLVAAIAMVGLARYFKSTSSGVSRR